MDTGMSANVQESGWDDPALEHYTQPGVNAIYRF